MTEKLERALSVRQPYAEQILNCSKVYEYRSRQTHVRGRVYVYAGKSTADLMRGQDFYPRGMIVGSVEIIGAEKLPDGTWRWLLANPIRYAKPWKPIGTPQPGFWKPRQI